MRAVLFLMVGLAISVRSQAATLKSMGSGLAMMHLLDCKT